MSGSVLPPSLPPSLVRRPGPLPQLAVLALLPQLAVLAVLPLLADPVSAATTARGRVFVDEDRDRVADPGEAGLAGVAVSNGREVILTDQEGGWSLPVEDGDVLFVTKPRDHALPTDEQGYPEFFFVHRPTGTPSELELLYEGLPPTGDLPPSVDFALWPESEPEAFEVLCFADTQPRGHRELDYLRDDVLAPLLDHPARAALVLGDVLYDDFAIAPRLKRLMGTLAVPWFAVPGNHDLNLHSPDDRRSLESYRRLFGPANYSFDLGQVHFVVMDDVDYAGVSESGSLGEYQGAFHPEQLRWLRADLDVVPEDRLVVLAVHIPLRNDLEPDSPVLNVLESGPLFDVLAGREKLFVLAGHAHLNEHLYLDGEEGWNGDRPLHQQTVGAACGAWWSGPLDDRGIPVSTQRDGSPNGVLLLEIEGTDYRTRWLSASEPVSHQMRLSLDSSPHRLSRGVLRDHGPGQMLRGPVARTALASTRLVVNFFAGGPRSTLRWSLDGGDWMELTPVRRTDPHVEELYSRHADTLPSWVEPAPTTHIWQAVLPRDLAGGTHDVQVRATDEFGEEHRGSMILEIVQD